MGDIWGKLADSPHLPPLSVGTPTLVSTARGIGRPCGSGGQTLTRCWHAGPLDEHWILLDRFGCRDVPIVAVLWTSWIWTDGRLCPLNAGGSWIVDGSWIAGLAGLAGLAALAALAAHS